MRTQSINVTLPTEIVYVSGTVNGTDHTWTRLGDAWQATVARANDETYVIALTAVTAAGISSEYALTIYYGILNLITDRTQADADRVSYLAQKVAGKTATGEEIAEYLTDLKGAYNASDLNRVGAAVEYVAGRLNEYGYLVSVEPKKDWVMGDIPTPSQMTAYLNDVSKLRAMLTVAQTTPEVPEDMEKLTWQEANDIEQILVDLDAMLTRMAAAWFYSGDLYSGEV